MGGQAMIQVTRLNQSVVYVNCDLIEFVEETPNTIVSMVSGRKLVVLETAQEITDLIVAYKRRIFGPEVTNKTLEQE
jgi:flagellar protein FlbD